MSDDFGFPPPPFQAEQAAQRVRREWRDWGLTERANVFERQGLAFAAVAISEDGTALTMRLVTRPSRQSPVWQIHTVKDHAQLRQVQGEWRKRLAAWSDRDD